MNPPSAHRPPTTDHRLPASGLRPRLGLGLGLGKLPAARYQPAPHLNLNLNLNQKPTFHLPLSAQSNIQNPKSKILNPLTPSPLNPLTPRRRPAAFTLIELMVAAAITTLLLLGMTGIFDQSMKAWRLSSRRADAEREIRAALSQLERDLSGAVVSARLPMYLNVVGNSRVSIPSALSSQLPLRVGSAGVNWQSISAVLFFSSIQPATPGQAGDLAGIGYFVAWDTNSNNGNGAWNLYRRYQSPTDLYSALPARMALPTLNLNSAGPYQINSIPSAEIVGANVLNFWVSPVIFVTNTSPGVAVPKTLPTNSNGDIDLAALGTGTWITNRPAYFQLELTAYGSEQVRGFVGGTETARKAMWGNTSNIAKFGRSFVWRVDL